MSGNACICICVATKYNVHTIAEYLLQYVILITYHRLQMAANQRRIEVIETVEEILDDLVTSVLHTADELEGISTSQDNVVTTGSTQEMHIEEERQAKEESESKVMKTRVQSIEIEVSDAEREADNDTRVQILLSLLELACSMVSMLH